MSERIPTSDDIAFLARCRAVGDVATNYHAVSLHIKSVLDGCGDDDNDQACGEEQASALPSYNTSVPTEAATRQQPASRTSHKQTFCHGVHL